MSWTKRSSTDWANWSPQLTADTNPYTWYLSNGANVYQKNGDLVLAHARMYTTGTSNSSGSGRWRISLPVPAVTGDFHTIGTWTLLTAGASSWYMAHGYVALTIDPNKAALVNSRQYTAYDYISEFPYGIAESNVPQGLSLQMFYEAA
jgi:hypothetical protein